jgi:hypothetical protein
MVTVAKDWTSTLAGVTFESSSHRPLRNELPASPSTAKCPNISLPVGFFGTSGRTNNKQNKNIQQIGNGEHPFMPNEPSLKARQLSAAKNPCQRNRPCRSNT